MADYVAGMVADMEVDKEANIVRDFHFYFICLSNPHVHQVLNKSNLGARTKKREEKEFHI